MVFIKKVTMKGFKSYGPRKVAVTMSPGFTCIVGPNGSGKSNVVDAVAFVIGLQSSKQLRAGVFSDLIYGGSKKVKAAKFAEVSIYFDNTDGKLPIDAPEVVVSRSIDISGKTVYRINKKRETRTYVVDLLAHADIFPEGHNLVMQGDITQFIKMSSEERRGIIEEISGIAEYNEKRERGQRELDRANENIARVELVLNEVASRLESLEKEKNDATRYKELRDEIYKNKGWLVRGELKLVRNTLTRIQENISQRTERKMFCESRMEELERLLIECEQTLRDAEHEIEKLSEERQVGLAREIEEIRGKMRVAESEMFHVSAALESLEKQKEASSRARERFEEEKKGLEERLTLSQHTRENEREILKGKEAEHARIIEGLSRSKEILDGMRKSLEEVEGKLQEKRTSTFSLTTEVEKISSEMTFASQKREEHESELIRLKESMRVLHERLEYVKRKQDESQSHHDTLKASLASLREDEKKTREQLYATEEELWKKRLRFSELNARLNVARESEAIRKNLGSGVVDILEAGEKGLIEGIFGTIASLGTTEEQYKSALEVAAGNRINNVVVDTDETARRCIMYLKERKSGRATFLPLNTIQGVSLRGSAIDNKEGVIDYAINLVKFQAQFEAAFRYVFGDTLVVRGMEDTKNKRERIVTLDGDLVERSGAITGGHYIKARYLSSFNVESDEAELSSLEQDISNLESFKEERKKRAGELSLRIAENEKRASSVERELALLQSKYEDESLSLHEKEESEKSIFLKKDELDRIMVTKKALREEGVSSLAHLESEILTLEEKRRKINAELSFEGVDLSSLEREMTSLRESFSRGERDIQDSTSRIEFLDEKMRELDGSISSGESLITARRGEMDSLKSQKNLAEKELEEKLDEEKSFFHVLQEKRERKDELKIQLETYRKEKETLKEEMYGIASKLEILATQKTENEQRFAELEEESKNFIVEGEYKDLKELRFKITTMEHEKESLEPINMRAIEEFDEVLARHSLLKTRTEKLYEERKSILDFIAEVEGQKKTVFMNTFSSVAQNFTIIFSELSPEGTAHLFVENEEDPFSGGIDLEANPGGKEVKRVDAMSGGEKALTALAFVFAIQRFKPAPFYILDEIDMHLDDVNCKRVAEMIKESSKTTQFIIITLRDVMMAAAELLYGVTIKSGLSKILSVKLEEIAQYKEPVPTVE
jgi:chromosome segregation protein